MEMTMTRTDRAFDASKPRYYIFEKLRVKVRCIRCQKHFDTHLAYTNFCSPDCKQKLLSGKA